MDYKNVGKSFMAQHTCQYCHKEATQYITYKDFFAFMCNNKDCDLKMRIKTGFYQTNIEIKEVK